MAQLFCLMAVMAGLRELGVFSRLGRQLLCRVRSARQLECVLVFLCFFTSMAITNDVALLTFVPFAALVLGQAGLGRHLLYVVVLQTVAANLGSMAMPVGNPQNLFLCSRFQIPMRDFFSTLLPLTLVSLAGLTAAALCTSGDPIQVEFRDVQRLEKGGQLRVMAGLFALCLLSVFRVLHYGVLTAVVIAAGLAVNRQLFRRVDYGLLATFFCFFVFSGNLGRIGAVRDWLTGLLEGHTALTAALASQVVSNVPAAVLLAGFTGDWRGLLVGTNVGGLGTPIASLASLISFRAYLRSEGSRPGRYLGVFTLANLAGLALLGLCAWAM